MAAEMKAVRVISTVVGSLAGLVVVLAIVNLGVTAAERRCYRAPGVLVDVGGGKMHVFSEGTGRHNVVLLSGLGTSSPVMDFAPLTRALSPDFRVSVVECFGYGWSDWTRKPRTNSNIVEEIRFSLKDAGIQPPYIIVPHSMSGIYALYWATKYPQEIRAVVALDTTVSAQTRYIRKRGFSPVFGIARAAGIVRVALLLKPGLVGYDSPAYCEELRSNIRRMASWNFMNRNIQDEARRAHDNLSEVEKYKFPAGIPVGMILSRETVENWSKVTPAMDWVQSHEDLLAGSTRGRVYVVDGGHNVYWQNSDTIAQVIREMDE
jgi:pimeloyl-ACP methyl ester carboxylesterase